MLLFATVIFEAHLEIASVHDLPLFAGVSFSQHVRQNRLRWQEQPL